MPRANIHNANDRLSAQHGQGSKVTVVCQYHPILRYRATQQILIACTGQRCLTHVENVYPL